MAKEIEIDYFKYDRIKLSLKADAYEKMLEFYKAFGWELLERKDDFRYIDIIHVRLIRAHKIKNKDKLQLLQVKMEKAVNKFAAKRRDRHMRSSVFGLTTGVLSLASIAFGITLLVKLGTSFALAVGIPLVAIGTLTPLITILPIRRMIRRENKSFMAAYREMGAEVSKILSIAEKLKEEAP